MNGSWCDLLPEQETLWRVLWLSLAAASILTLKSEWMHCLILHGKVKRNAPVDHLPFARLLQLDVPKSSWKWFYLTGSLENWTIIVIMMTTDWRNIAGSALSFDCPKLNSNDADALLSASTSTTITIFLYACHTTRRLLESFLITSFGDAKMHAGAFILGIVHYTSVPLAILTDSNASKEGSVGMLTYIGMLLFLYASYHQYRCNTLLAAQKVQSGGKYVAPKGDWFHRVRCPLYSSEILLYISMSLMLTSNITMHLIMLWVLANQVVCAKFGSAWYEQKFRDKLEEMPKWVLVPGLW